MDMLLCIKTLFILNCSVLVGISWKQGQWGRDEIDLLKSNIMQYCKVGIMYAFPKGLVCLIVVLHPSNI